MVTETLTLEYELSFEMKAIKPGPLHHLISVT